MNALNSNPGPPLGRRSPTPDAIAPDGSEIRLLVGVSEGAYKSSLVEVTLEPGEVSRPIRHRTVEEAWYVLGGFGRVWRCPPGSGCRRVPHRSRWGCRSRCADTSPASPPLALRRNMVAPFAHPVHRSCDGWRAADRSAGGASDTLVVAEVEGMSLPVQFDPIPVVAQADLLHVAKATLPDLGDRHIPRQGEPL